MIPTPVLLTFVLVCGIIGAAYYFLVLKPEQDEQSALRKRLKSSLPGGKGKATAQAGLLKEDTPFSNIPAVNTLLNTLGRGLVAQVERNAAYTVVAGAVGVLVYLYLLNQLLLFGAALVATSQHGRVTDLARGRVRRRVTDG